LSLQSKLSVICIVEVKPKRNIAIQNSEIFIHSHKHATTNIQKSGQRHAIYMKNGLEYQQTPDTIDYNAKVFETIFKELKLSTQIIVIGCAYRSPFQSREDKHESLQDLNKIMSTVALTRKPVYLAGDFNFPESNWQLKDSLRHPFILLLRENFLSQLITEPSRCRANKKENVLDLIVTCSP